MTSGASASSAKTVHGESEGSLSKGVSVMPRSVHQDREVVAGEGVFLYHGAGDDGWVIGSPLGRGALKGSKARHSEANEDSWRSSAGKPASVRVTGSD